LIIFQKLILAEDLRDNPGLLYLFGDNEKRVGRGGQAAVMRGQPNALGIRTKKAPTWQASDFWSDACYEGNVKMIDEDFSKVEEILSEGFRQHIVIPSDGLGTGRANLPELAPRTFEYLEQKIVDLSLRMNKRDRALIWE